MAVQVCDVVVIGLGPGGSDLAGRLARAGLDVIGVEKHLVGGECRYYGCTPSKMLIRATEAVQEAERARPAGRRAGGAWALATDLGANRARGHVVLA